MNFLSMPPHWQRWLVAAALVFAVAFAGLHLVGAVREATRVLSHRHDAIAPWMTVGHVARINGVAPEALEEAVGLAPGASGRRPLRLIAQQQGQSFEELQAKLMDAIARLQPAGAPPPGSVPPSAAP